MNLFGFLKSADINSGLKEYDVSPHALLLDVRTAQEFREGHIPGSQNVPLQNIDKVDSIVHNKNIPLYVYCQSGSRSRLAAGLLQQMGYKTVKNLGGFSAYQGKVEY